MSDDNIGYVPSVTLAQFHNDNSMVRCVVGPVGSGKSVGMCLEILKRATEQKPHNNVRYTRFLVIRQTYAELKSTTIKTFMRWLGGLGTLTMDSPIRFQARRTLPDGTIMDMQVWFLPLDQETDIKRLKSLEVTAAWINEASEIADGVLDMLLTRVGRYPDKQGGGGASWSGVFMDTNPPTVRHWIYDTFEVKRPNKYRLFRQPPAILFDPDMNEGLGGYVPNMLAENVTNLPGGFDYYLNQTLGASDSFIRVFCMGEYGQIMDGKPVYGNYNDRIHRASAPLFKSKQIPLIIGMDWGLQPAAAITQMSPRGQLAVLRELAPTDVTFDDFLNEWLVPCLKGEFGGYPVQVIGDPAGTARSALSSKTVYEVLRSRGIAAEPAISNDFNLRRDSVDYFLKRNGGFIVDPSCTVIIEGFQGAYRYSKVTIKNARAVPRPEKNYASHPHDALQYAASYYYQQVLKRIRPGRNKPQPAKKRYLYA